MIKNEKQFKISLIVPLFFVITNLLIAQTNRFDVIQPSQPYISSYVKPNYDVIMQVGAAMQQRYDQNKAYRDDLIKWIFDLKTKTNDQEFLNAMDVNYKKLRYYDDDDFGALGSELSNIKNDISEEIDKCNTRVKELPNKLWDSGLANYKSANYNQAINDFTSLIRASPDFINSYLYRGLSYINTNNYSLSLIDFNTFIDKKSDDKFAYNNRGIVKFNLNDYIGSISDFNKVIELDPNNFYAYFWRARCKSHLGDNYGSISDNNKVIELNPDNSMAYNNRGWDKFLLKNYAEAIVDLNKAIILDPSNSVAYDSRQETKFALNDLDGCIKDCDMTIKLNGKCSNSWFFRGRAYYKKGFKTLACADWSKAGELGKAEAYVFISKYCK